MAVIDEDVRRAGRTRHNQAAIPTHVTPCGYARVSALCDCGTPHSHHCAALCESFNVTRLHCMAHPDPLDQEERYVNELSIYQLATRHWQPERGTPDGTRRTECKDSAGGRRQRTPTSSLGGCRYAVLGLDTLALAVYWMRFWPSTL